MNEILRLLRQSCAFMAGTVFENPIVKFRLVVCGFFVSMTLVAGTALFAQPVPERYPTLSWKCHTCSMIFRAKITSFQFPEGELTDRAYDLAIEVQVEEILKGQAGNEVTLHALLMPFEFEFLRQSIESSKEFLFFVTADGDKLRIEGNQRIETELWPYRADLVESGLRMGRARTIWHDFTRKHYVDAQRLDLLVRETLDANSEYEISDSLEIRASPFEILVAPADERVFQFCRDLLHQRRDARAMNSSQSGVSGRTREPYVDAMHILASHEGENNVELFVSLLDTTIGSDTFVRETENEIYAERFFPIRRTAHWLLAEMGREHALPADQEIVWRRPKVHSEFEAIDTVRQLGGRISYDMSLDEPEEQFTRVQTIYLNNCTAIPDLSPFEQLAKVEIRNSDIEDHSPLLGAKDSVQFLDAGSSSIDNDDLVVIAQLTNLEMLDLSRTSITDVSALAELPKLNYLILEKTGVEDLSPLHGHPSLVTVKIDGRIIDWREFRN